MKIKNTEHFGIQRKIVSNMTTESWATIPHVTYMYEPDITDFMEEYKRLNKNRKGNEKISLNTVIVKAICNGLKAAPAMNAHIQFNRRLVRGRIDTMENIDISMPMILPNGEMMTINMHNFDSKNLDEMTEYIADVQRRLEKTDLNEAMYSVSIDNTMTNLRKGKVMQTILRLVGSKTGKHRIRLLKGKEKKAYNAIPDTDRITKRDIEQGTVTISNIGSIYKNQRGAAALLEIIPPQVSAFAIGAIQEKPVVVSNGLGKKEIAIRKVLPMCIAFDHRALDFGDIVPFLECLDGIFENPQVIHSWTDNNNSIIHKVAI